MSINSLRSAQPFDATNEKRPRIEVDENNQEVDLFAEVPIVDNQTLLRSYERVGIIAGHLECTVFDVKKRDCPGLSARALKINLVEPQINLIKELSQLNSQHLVTTSLIGRIQVRPIPFISFESNDLFVLEPRKGNKERWAFVYEMERMEGNLRELRLSKVLSPVDEVVIEFQRVFIEASLNMLGFILDDIKEKNVVYTSLPEGDPRLACDYWRYRIGTKAYYLPRIKYWVKLCDFDHWERPKKLAPCDFAEVLKERFKKAPQILVQFKQFEKRPKKGEILDINLA